MSSKGDKDELWKIFICYKYLSGKIFRLPKEKPREQRSLVGYNPWGHKESDTAKHQGITTTCAEMYKIKDFFDNWDFAFNR